MSVAHVIQCPPNGLDPIALFIDDFEPGRGRLTVECYGCAWSCFWGAMGRGSSVLRFLASCDADYVANCLIRGRRQFISSKQHERREFAYLKRICEAVVAFAGAPDRLEGERA